MRLKVAVIYNQPDNDRYQAMGENKPELGVMDEVEAVEKGLAELRYGCVMVPLRPPLEDVQLKLQALAGQGIDVVFNLFEGFDGKPETEAQVAQILTDFNFAYTGCPPSALALALDKEKSKKLFLLNGIPTADFQILTPQNLADFHLPFPCFVKPVNEDASHGIGEESVVRDPGALKRQVEKICALFGGRAMVEEYLDGREFNTTVLGNERLFVPGISEIVFTLPPDKPRILSYSAKWDEGCVYFENTRAVCPAAISESQERQVARVAREAFRLVGCRGYARVDFRQDKDENFKVLEVNPNPDITPGSGAARQTAAAGMSYSQFMERVINYALNCSSPLRA
jgi:D-alanine-D-alanine ligase